MIKSKGELMWCPFRTRKHVKYIIEGDVETTHFMPCMKEECICYERHESDDTVIESCYRDNIGYSRIHNKKDEKQNE